MLMRTNADITLYNYHNGKYHRKVIEGVFWDNVKQSNILKSGAVSSDAVSLFIPVLALPEGYTKPKQYNNLADVANKYTLQANSKDLIVKGVVGYEFDNTSQATVSTGVKYLKDNYDDVVTVSVVDEKLYGDESMQHYKLSCK